MNVGPAFWYSSAGGGGGPAPEDYLVDLNGFANKAAALAFYTADGVTINDVTTTLFVRDMMLHDDHIEDPHGGVVPPGQVFGNPVTPYMLYVGFEGSPSVFTINIDVAMQIKSLALDRWQNSSGGLTISTAYSGGEWRDVEDLSSDSGFPMSRLTIAPPGGLAAASYLTSITFTLTDGRFAWDNMLLKVS